MRGTKIGEEYTGQVNFIFKALVIKKYIEAVTK